MRIERLQVEEGFLEGLDLHFDPGLNVLIGARGVGKTSILELIRYALRLPHVDQRRAAAAKTHAEAVLAGGRVTVTFTVDGHRQTVARSASDPDVPGAGRTGSRSPLVLGQNELEGIGLDPGSRLQLIDSLAATSVSSLRADSNRLRAEIKSLTSQMQTLAEQRESLRQQALVRPSVAKELDDARAAEEALLGRASSDINDIRMKLADIGYRKAASQRALVASTSVSADLSEVRQHAGQTGQLLRTVRDDLLAEEGLGAHVNEFNEILETHRHLVTQIDEMLSHLADSAAERSRLVGQLDDEARPYRRQYDEFEVGAGAAAQRTAQLEQQLADIDVAHSRLEVLSARIAETADRRSTLLLQLDLIAEDVWRVRQEVIDRLNRQFSPRIKLRGEHFGDRTAYVSALAAALRGSGLQYNQLADWISERVSPEELVRAVEAGDASHLGVVAELTSARVEKLVGHLASSDQLGGIIAAPVEDTIELNLLVGRDYRRSNELSTGQRCAVVLPLLLADRERLLLLDQPEDHLDNAYLVDNTVRSIIERENAAQTIVATHNANVPVLGGAREVVVLRSDGRRGYADRVGMLLDPAIVGSITDLMEGGVEAFERRAAFYSSGRRP